MAAGAATLVLNYWQIIILFAFALVPVVWFIDSSRVATNRRIMLVLVIMLVMNLAAASSSRKFDYKVSYTDQVNAYCEQTFGADKCRTAPVPEVRIQP